MVQYLASTYKYDYKQVAELLIKNFGNKSAVAQALGCDWNTVNKYCKDFKYCADALAVARNRWVDMAENRLARKVEAGDNWAIGKVLNDLGRERGWGKAKSIEISGPGGGPIPLEWED